VLFAPIISAIGTKEKEAAVLKHTDFAEFDFLRVDELCRLYGGDTDLANIVA